MAWVFRRTNGIETGATTVQTIEPTLRNMRWFLSLIIVVAFGACTSGVPTPTTAAAVTPTATVVPALTVTPSPTTQPLPMATGLPTTPSTATPTPAPPTTPSPTRTAAVVSSKYQHACAVTRAGGVQCWGYNGGRLGDGTFFMRSPPVDVIGLTDAVVTVAAGLGHTCVITTEGRLQCWGDNFFGVLGDGTTTDSSTPTDVSGLTSRVASVSVGATHTCAVTADGAVQCWGENMFGQLGDGTILSSPTPLDVIGLTIGATAVAAGSHHTCAIIAGGGVQCWGLNFLGQLGDGTITGSPTPVSVIGLTSGVSAIAAGQEHACAITAAGGLQCWGRNFSGQLGAGTIKGSRTPVDVTGLTSGVAAVAGGGFHTCAVTTAGGAQCWGDNFFGQLGNGTNTGSSVPVDVAGLTHGVVAIATGTNHTCAATTVGSFWCWGANAEGQLGDGTTTDSSTPVEVRPTGGTAVTAGLPPG